MLYQRNAKGQLVPVKNQPAKPAATATPAQLTAKAEQIAKGLDAQLIPLVSPNANITTASPPNLYRNSQRPVTQEGRSWNGPIFVATPQLLKEFGITSSEINPNADILTSRPGLSGMSGLGLSYGPNGGGKGLPSPVGSSTLSCTAATQCLLNPVIQEIGALPTGTSAPNTVITEHAMLEFHITTSTSAWFVQGNQPFTSSQISNAEAVASTTQLSVESKNDQPTSSAVIGWATIFGIVIALGVLGMSVGLVRSETANELRALAATGASSYTRRTLTAVTAGALGFLGALLGVVGGYVGMIGWLRSNSLNGGIAALGNIPVADLLLILLGMPAFAAAIGWVFAGREPAVMAHQPIE